MCPKSKGGGNILKENTLYGEIDRVQVAIDRLRTFENQAKENHPNGYAVMDSGGKDSNVIKAIAYLSGVKFEIIHSHTTADHPLTVQYIREEQRRWQEQDIPYSIVYPTYKGERTSLWKLIALKGAPTRFRRWCCDIIKEKGAGKGRYTVTGVRWSESTRRKQTRTVFELPSGKRERIKLNNDNDAQRQMIEHCFRRGQFVINPVIDWDDGDIWEFHRLYHLPHNPLYDMGCNRVGCVGCPMSDHNGAELEQYPEFKKMYLHAFRRYLNSRPDLVEKFGWTTEQEFYDWWVSHLAMPRDDGQLNIYDMMEANEDDDVD